MKMMCVKTVEVQGRVAFREGNVYEFKKAKHMGVAAYEVTSESGYGIVSKDDPTMKSFVKKSDYEKSVELYKKLNESKYVLGVDVAKNNYEKIYEEAEEYLDKLLNDAEKEYDKLDFNFHINEQKGIVTCFVKGKETGEKYNDNTKFATCHPNDTFNATIGKIISLSRTLGNSIPEKFLNI